jgi:hypothetical protein
MSCWLRRSALTAFTSVSRKAVGPPRQCPRFHPKHVISVSQTFTELLAGLPNCTRCLPRWARGRSLLIIELDLQQQCCVVHLLVAFLKWFLP